MPQLTFDIKMRVILTGPRGMIYSRFDMGGGELDIIEQTRHFQSMVFCPRCDMPTPFCNRGSTCIFCCFCFVFVNYTGTRGDSHEYNGTTRGRD